MEQEQKQGMVVPFGKYKGKPMEVLQHDQQYTDWLLGQDWFRDKYQAVYNIIVNNFGEPAETPEHNQMQVKFLKLDWRLKLCLLIDAQLFTYNDIFFKEHLQAFFKGQDIVTLEIVNALRERVAELKKVIEEHQIELSKPHRSQSRSFRAKLPSLPSSSLDAESSQTTEWNEQEVAEFTYQVPSSPFEGGKTVRTYRYTNQKTYGSDDPRVLLQGTKDDFETFKQYFYEVHKRLKEITYIDDSYLQFEDSGFDVCYRLTVGCSIDLTYFHEKIKKLLKSLSQTDFYPFSKEEKKSISANRSWFFELSKLRGGQLFLELKPSMGDDFPAVLRQIKVNKTRVIEKNRPQHIKAAWMLVIGSYTGQGAAIPALTYIIRAYADLAIFY